MIEVTRASRPRRTPMALLVPNRVEASRLGHMGEALSGLSERRGPTVRQLREHIEAFAAGSWIGRHAPDSPATQNILALADAVQLLLNMPPGTDTEASAVRAAAIDATPEIST